MERRVVIRQRTTNPLGFTRGFLPNRYRTLFYRAPVGKLIRDGRYDLVHIHNLMPTAQMRRVAKAATAAGVPYVVSTHGIVEAVGGPAVYSLTSLPQRLAWRAFVDRPLRWVFPHGAGVLALSAVRHCARTLSRCPPNRGFRRPERRVRHLRAGGSSAPRSTRC